MNGMRFCAIVISACITPTVFGVDIVGTPENVGPGQPVLDLRGTLYLLAAVALLTFSFVLLAHAVRVTKWLTTDDDAAPDPSAGVEVCVGSGVALGVVWCVAMTWLFEIDDPVAAFLQHPRVYLPGVLLASSLPGALAVLKFFTAAAMQKQSGGAATASVGAVVAVINFVASIATLIGFARTFQVN